MNFKRYLVLLGVIIFSAIGDCCLSRGMREVGSVSLRDWHLLFLAFANPWIVVGVLLLLAFFASYLSSLSWADLTYVLPATAISYILVALIARFVLEEHVSPVRWVGIALIAAGVGFVATGSHQTKPSSRAQEAQAAEVRG